MSDDREAGVIDELRDVIDDLEERSTELRETAADGYDRQNDYARGIDEAVSNITDVVEKYERMSERDDCDECGDGGGGLCPECKDEALKQKRT